MINLSTQKGEFVILHAKKHPQNGHKVSFERIMNNQVMFSYNRGNTNLFMDLNEFNKTWFIERIENVSSK